MYTIDSGGGDSPWDLGEFLEVYSEAVLQPATIELMFGEYDESTDLSEGQMGLIWVHRAALIAGKQPVSPLAFWRLATGRF
jgi:hypothetical protein